MPSSLEGGGSSQGGGSAVVSQERALSLDLETTYMKVASGTLNLTGVRVWRGDGTQQLFGSSETGTIGLSSTDKTVASLIKSGSGGASGRGEDAGVGPIVLPKHTHNVVLRRVPTDTVNDSFTTPFRPFGYGDVLTFGAIPIAVPVVHVPLWMYAFKPSSNGNVVVETLDINRQTLAEASCAVLAANSYTIHSMLGGSWVNGAVQARITADVNLKWNYGGNTDATVGITPLGANLLVGGKRMTVGVVDWHCPLYGSSGECLTRQDVAEASIAGI